LPMYAFVPTPIIQPATPVRSSPPRLPPAAEQRQHTQSLRWQAPMTVVQAPTMVPTPTVVPTPAAVQTPTAAHTSHVAPTSSVVPSPRPAAAETPVVPSPNAEPSHGTTNRGTTNPEEDTTTSQEHRE
jgi:hypothetical protein